MDQISHWAEQISGLNPKAWIVLGPGVSREAAKEHFLAHSSGLTSNVVVDLKSLCLHLLQDPPSVLGSTLRIEILERLTKKIDLISHFPELRKLKRKNGFLFRLDRALQKGRLCFGFDEDFEVLFGRLQEKRGEALLQEEVFRFSKAYETYLSAQGLCDEPMLYLKAVEALRDHGDHQLPEKILVIKSNEPENREAMILDELSHHCELSDCDLLIGNSEKLPEKIAHEIHHSLDDSMFQLAYRLSISEDLDQECILIQDQPEIRRSLLFALNYFNVPLVETRNPLQMRQSESIKKSLLILKIVASGYSRTSVLEWIEFLKDPKFQHLKKDWIKEINRRAVRRGLKSYQSGKLSDLYALLQIVEKKFGQRMKFSELKEKMKLDENAEILSLFEALEDDLETLDELEKKAPVLFWLKRIEHRIEKASPRVAKIKNKKGVEIHLLSQASLWQQRGKKRVWVLGLDEKYFYDHRSTDYFFNERDRELVGDEFGLKTSRQLKDQKIKTLRSWLEDSEEVRFVDYEFQSSGKEKELLSTAFESLFGEDCERETVEYRAFSHFDESYQTNLSVPDQQIKLSSFDKIGKAVVEATELDRASRCSFQALSTYRWNLKDEREPELDLWPDVKGNLIHRSIELLLKSKQSGTSFAMLTKDALNQAWEELKPQGLLKGRHSDEYFKRQLLGILEKFCEDEIAYSKRAQTKVFSIEKQTPLSIQIDGMTIRGIADRIDEKDDSFFVIDYKTTTDLPSGQEMVKDGYRLQLPFYALAVESVLKKPCVGLQFVSLGRKVSRSKGVFFKSYNGKEEGKLTNTRSKLSMFEEHPTEIWHELKSQIKDHLKTYSSGVFEARPKKPTECARCRMIDLCGRRRVWSNQFHELGS